jgi:hypothetical protein
MSLEKPKRRRDYVREACKRREARAEVKRLQSVVEAERLLEEKIERML